MKVLLVYGSITKGHQFIGPFKSVDIAQDYHETLGHLTEKPQYLPVENPHGYSYMAKEFNSNQKKYMGKAALLAKTYADSEGMGTVPQFLLEIAEDVMNES